MYFALALAMPPIAVPVHGLLIDGAGAPVHGEHSITLVIRAGAATETETAVVTVTQGAFAALWVPDGTVDLRNGATVAVVFNGVESAPVALGFAPYAALAADSDKLGGYAASAFLRSGQAANVGALTAAATTLSGALSAPSGAFTGAVSAGSVETGAVSGTTGTFSSGVSGASVTATGAVAGASGSFTGAVGAGSFSTTGNISGGALSGLSASLTGALSAASASITGALSAASASITGALSAASASITGALSAGSVSAGSAAVTGALKLGVMDNTACNSGNAGALRWVASNKSVQVCDGAGAWLALTNEFPGSQQSAPGASCKAIQTAGFSRGDGLYWLDPNGGASTDAFQAWCDMTTDGGGWTMCYSERDNMIRLQTQSAFAGTYGTAGYRSDCRNLPFREVLYVNHDSGQKAWFTRQTAADVVLSSVGYNLNGSTLGLWTGKGVANTGYSFQLLVCDTNWMWTGLFMSGNTSCTKDCGSWCSDTTSQYYRTDGSDTTSYNGVSFAENGHTNVSYKTMSVGVR